MALAILNSPATYSSVHGELIFTVYNADNLSQPGYKYICDVYVGGVNIFRSKKFPDPTTNIGVFKVGAAIRNYLSQQLNPTAAALRSQEIGANAFFVDAVCQFGEEYDLTLYSNLLTDSTRRYYNHYNGRVVNGQTVLSTLTNKVLSNRPYENKVGLTDAFSFLPYFPTTTTAIPIQVKTYNEAGLVATNNTTITPTAANNMQLLNVAPVGINAVFSGVITSATTYYTIQIGSTSIYKFTLKCENIHTPYVLHFMNQYGAFESKNFNKLSRRKFNVEKKEFTQSPLRVNESGVVSYTTSNNVGYDTRTVYASRFGESLLLSTDILKDAEYTWLKELVFSPIVYIQEGNYLTPITITETDYEQRKRVNDRLTGLQINAVYGEQYNAQFR